MSLAFFDLLESKKLIALFAHSSGTTRAEEIFLPLIVGYILDKTVPENLLDISQTDMEFADELKTLSLGGIIKISLDKMHQERKANFSKGVGVARSLNTNLLPPLL